jgi:hypothetical protein
MTGDEPQVAHPPIGAGAYSRFCGRGDGADGKALFLGYRLEEIPMQTPLQITAHDLTLSDAVETDIREKAAKLEHYFQRMIS